MINLINNGLFELLEKKAKHDGVVKIVVGGVVFLGEEVLVCQRAVHEFMAGLIEIPSGSIEVNESLQDGLIREIYEETGLRVNCIYLFLGHFDYISGSGKKTRQFNFLVRCEEGAIILNPSEHEKYYLIKHNDIENMNISQKTKKIITIAFTLQSALYLEGGIVKN